MFHLFEARKTRAFLHALAGAGLVDSAVPVTGTEYLQGWVARPAYAFGGGIERTVAGPFAVRLTGDYLRTAYADSTGDVRSQNNLRFHRKHRLSPEGSPRYGCRSLKAFPSAT